MEIININDKYSVYSYLINKEEYDIKIDTVSDIWYDPYIKSIFIVNNKEVVKMIEFNYENYINYIREIKIQKIKN